MEKKLKYHKISLITIYFAIRSYVQLPPRNLDGVGIFSPFKSLKEVVELLRGNKFDTR